MRTDGWPDMTNKGFEIGLETVNIQAKDSKGFNWRTGLNLSINRNEVTKLANNEPFSSYVNRVQVGHDTCGRELSTRPDGWPVHPAGLKLGEKGAGGN